MFGKVHLVVNCLIETELVLEYESPLPSSGKSGALWKHHEPSSNTFLFLGHRSERYKDFLKRLIFTDDTCSDPSDVTITTALLGNILLFSQSRLSLRSNYCLLKSGPNLKSLLECLSDSNVSLIFIFSSHLIQLLFKSPYNKDHRINFRRERSSSTPDDNISFSGGGNCNLPPPFLFQLLNQTSNPDIFFDEVIGADVSSNIKLLQVLIFFLILIFLTDLHQETLILSFSPKQPEVFYLYETPSATSSKRKTLFRRSDFQMSGSDFNCLIQTGSRFGSKILETPQTIEFFTFSRSSVILFDLI